MCEKETCLTPIQATVLIEVDMVIYQVLFEMDIWLYNLELSDSA